MLRADDDQHTGVRPLGRSGQRVGLRKQCHPFGNGTLNDFDVSAYTRQRSLRLLYMRGRERAKRPD